MKKKRLKLKLWTPKIQWPLPTANEKKTPKAKALDSKNSTLNLYFLFVPNLS